MQLKMGATERAETQQSSSLGIWAGCVFVGELTKGRNRNLRLRYPSYGTGPGAALGTRVTHVDTT